MVPERNVKMAMPEYYHLIAPWPDQTHTPHDAAPTFR
jgi:hypothetical protein